MYELRKLTQCWVAVVVVVLGVTPTSVNALEIGFQDSEFGAPFILPVTLEITDNGPDDSNLAPGIIDFAVSFPADGFNVAGTLVETEGEDFVLMTLTDVVITATTNDLTLNAILFRSSTFPLRIQPFNATH